VTLANYLGDRLGNRLAGGSLSPANTYEQILAGYLVGRWDSRTGVSSLAPWVGQTGPTLVNAGTPSVGADGSDFGGANIVYYNAISSHANVDTTPDLIADGARPWVGFVGRAVSNINNRRVLRVANNALADNGLELISVTGNWRGLWAGNTIATEPNTTTPSFWEVFLTSAGVAGMRRDGALLGTSGTGQSMAAATDYVSVGGIGIVGSDTVAAMLLVCNAEPPAARMTILRTKIRDDWGTP
jgi:hypothetical protein